MSAGSSRPFTSGSRGTSGRQRVIVCYNCKGEGHMAKQYTKPKRKRYAEWFKDKVLLVQAQASGQVALMANLSHYGSDNLAKALGFQNPCYLKKAQQLEPKLYDGCVIEKSEAIVVPDTEETLMLTEESRSKMIEKQNDPQMIDKKVITKPINYAILNQLSTEFETRFVPQTESSAEQAFWSQYSVQTDEPNLSGTTTVEVPKELPKVSMAKDIVIINLKEKLNSLNGDVKDRDVIRNVEESETLNIEVGHQVTKLATENNHLKQTYKQLYDSIKSLRVPSKEQCDDLIKKVNIKSVEVSDLNARLQEKVLVIIALKEQLDKLKGKAVITKDLSLNSIDPKLLKVDVTPVVPKLHKNKTA
nr:hypothetical protein [Tanacetum cinerariifolium]